MENLNTLKKHTTHQTSASKKYKQKPPHKLTIMHKWHIGTKYAASGAHKGLMEEIKE